MDSQSQPSQKFGIIMLREWQEESLYQQEERQVSQISEATSKSKIKKSEVKYYYKVW